MSTSTPTSIPTPPTLPPIPPGFKPHTENKATILLPLENTPFLNPVQEYNRDLSVAVIRQWNRVREREGRRRWEEKTKRRNEGGKGKGKKDALPDAAPELSSLETTLAPAPPTASTSTADATSIPKSIGAESESQPAAASERPHEFRLSKFNIIEALSATGLRSIRYAQELDDVGIILANDFSPSACLSMTRNITHNHLHPTPYPTLPSGLPNDGPICRGRKRRKFQKGGVVVNEGDANTLMYRHREEGDRVEVVDLDPYGTAAGFVDAGVQATADGGLLCVTCTDLAVLAGPNYPEKCFANYGGTPAKAEYCHEGALRLVLSSISSVAARYGRYIQPVLSLSIDFYVRVWVRIFTGQGVVKHTFAKHGITYICTYCQSHHLQPFGRVQEKPTQKGNVTETFKFASGVGMGGGDGGRCEECGSGFSVGGPLWLGPIHDSEFVGQLIEELEKEKDRYGTYARMKGMLTMARDELEEPFYFTPAKVASFFHSVCPPLADVVNALLNGGYKVSRSHACAGSLKTTAPRQFVHDIFREWNIKNPVREDKIATGSPALKLVRKEKHYTIDWTPHPEAHKLMDKAKLVRYQTNPTKNWGPGSRAKVVSAERATADAAAYASTENGGASVEGEVPTGDEAELQEMGLLPDPVGLSNDNGAEVAEIIPEKRKREGDEVREDVKRSKVERDEEEMMNT